MTCGFVTLSESTYDDNSLQSSHNHHYNHTMTNVMMMIISTDMIFVNSLTQAYTLTFRNLPEENA